MPRSTIFVVIKPLPLSRRPPAQASLVIAELARLARGRVLVLAHVKELVAQNHAKYQALGLEAEFLLLGSSAKRATVKCYWARQSVARNLMPFRVNFRC